MATKGLRRVPLAGLPAGMEKIVDALNDSAGVTVDTAVPATANAEFSLRHELGRKAREVQLVSQDQAGTLYRSSVFRWTRNLVYLRYSAPGGRIVVRVR